MLSISDNEKYQQIKIIYKVITEIITIITKSIICKKIIMVKVEEKEKIEKIEKKKRVDNGSKR